MKKIVNIVVIGCLFTSCKVVSVAKNSEIVPKVSTAKELNFTANNSGKKTTIVDSVFQLAARARSMGYIISVDTPKEKTETNIVSTVVLHPNYFSTIDPRVEIVKKNKWASVVLIPQFRKDEAGIYVTEALRTICEAVKDVIPIYNPWPDSKRSSLASFKLLYNDNLQSHGLNFWKSNIYPWALNTYHLAGLTERIFNSVQTMFAMSFGQENPDMPKGTKLRIGLTTFVIHGVIYTVLLNALRK